MKKKLSSLQKFFSVSSGLLLITQSFSPGLLYLVTAHALTTDNATQDVVVTDNQEIPTVIETPISTPMVTETPTPSITEEPVLLNTINQFGLDTTNNPDVQTIVLKNIDANTVDLTGVNTNGSAIVSTDKADYAPTDTAVISGSNLNIYATYTLIVASTDKPEVYFSVLITTDSNGAFIYAYQLDGNYRPNYTVKVIDNNNTVITSTTFTDTVPDSTPPTVHFVFQTPGPSATSFQAVFSEDVNLAAATNPANYFLHNWPGAGGSGNLVGEANINYNTLTYTATISFTNPGWYISPEQTWGVQDVHDIAGNLLATNPYSETSTPMVPPVTTASGIDANWHNTPVTVTFNCTDVNGSGCDKTYYSIDSTSFVEGTSVVISADGQHTVAFKSTDRAGNTEATNLSAQTVNIDTSAPSVPVLTSPIGGIHTNNNKPLMQWDDSTDTGSGVAGYYYRIYYKCTNEADVPASCSGLFPNLTGMWRGISEYQAGTTPDGVYFWQVMAQDNASNQSAWSGFKKLVIDTVKPVLTLPSDITVEANTLGGGNVSYIATANDIVDGSLSVNCDHSNGFFPIGTTQVNCSATDLAGNTTTGFFTVTVLDTTAPTFTSIIKDKTAEATSPSGANVNFTVTAYDIVDGVRPVVCIPASGSLFPLGQTTVNCSASDLSGHTSFASFKVNVADTKGPKFDHLSNIILEATSSSGAVATFSITANDAVDGTIPATCTPDSGSTFPLGLLGTKVNCTATDNAGNVGHGSFRVFVLDRTAPVFDETPNLTFEATGPNGASVIYSVTATDLGGNITPLCIRSSGQVFSLGTQTVFCIAIDKWFNISTRTFTVTVEDTTPPAVTVPEDKTVEATGLYGAYVDFATEVSAVDLVDGSITPACNPASGSAFALGATTVTCSATDSHGNAGSNSFKINVVDTTNPTAIVALPSPGDYSTDQLVTLSSTDNNSSGLFGIFYTIDGSTPSKSSTLYTTPIVINHDMTIKAIAYDNVGNASDIFSGLYQVPPKISAEASSSATLHSITITWTTDDPSTSRVVYDTVSHPILGTAPNYGYALSTIEDSTKATSHTVVITGLTSGTTYYYRVISHGSPEAIGTEGNYSTVKAQVLNTTDIVITATPTVTPTVSPTSSVLGAAATPTVTPTPTVQGQDSGASFWLWILAAACVLIIGGYIYYKRRGE